ncbi:hypothetical protein WJX74_006860 [Apatococcus lobatus]
MSLPMFATSCTLPDISQQRMRLGGGAQAIASPVLCSASSTQQSHGSPCVEFSRRQCLEASWCVASAGWLCFSPPASAAQYQRGISRYVRTKQLDDLESYVPLVIEARSQLQKAGNVMGQDAQSARLLLRDGAFSGLRDNIKALGTYAGRAKKEDGKLADNFFSAVQSYDFTLQRAIKTSKPVPGEAQQQLETTMQALDRLLATVPKDIMDKSQHIIEDISGPVPDSESEAGVASGKFRAEQIEQFLLK